MKLRTCSIWIAVVLTLAFVHAVYADNFQWADGTGSWTVLNNWYDLNNPDGSSPPDYAPSNLPGTSDSVTINTGSVTLNAGSSISSLSINATLSIAGGGNLVVINGETVGSGGTGSVIQTSGSHTPLTLTFGYSSGSSGSYNLSGGVLNVNKTVLGLDEVIGFYGAGSFMQTGGSHYVGLESLLLAYGPGSTGSYTLVNGILASANSENVGYMGNAQFTQSGGTNTISGAGPLWIGQQGGAIGSYSLSGGVLIASTSELVGGNAGTGTFTHSAGANTCATLYVGLGSGSSGTYTLSGGFLNSLNNEFVGNSGNGTFKQTGGTHTVTGSLTLAANSGSSGTYNLIGGTLNVSGNLNINSGGILTGNGMMSGAVVNGGAGCSRESVRQIDDKRQLYAISFRST